MDILVFSDSHGTTVPMETAIRKLNPDLVLHLGDYDADARALATAFPRLTIRAVRGNCDFGSLTPLEDHFTIESVRVVMTHGHKYKVKSGYGDIHVMGQAEGADILLFGHTHIPYYEQIGGMHVLNPGSANSTFGHIQITEGNILCSLSVYADL
ncbi:MAG: metallophosphoesterase [Oscillospiraceae bacterium]|nr:metallophosphoesterase [Oscillospiraceae bacterium]